MVNPLKTFSDTDLNSFNLEVQNKIFDTLTDVDVTDCNEQETIEKFIPVMENINTWLRNFDFSSYLNPIPKDASREKFEALSSRVRSMAKISNETSPRNNYKPKLQDEVFYKIYDWTQRAITEVNSKHR